MQAGLCYLRIYLWMLSAQKFDVCLSGSMKEICRGKCCTNKIIPTATNKVGIEKNRAKVESYAFATQHTFSSQIQQRHGEKMKQKYSGALDRHIFRPAVTARIHEVYY